MPKRDQIFVEEILSTFDQSKIRTSVEEAIAQTRNLFGKDCVCEAKKPPALGSKS